MSFRKIALTLFLAAAAVCQANSSQQNPEKMFVIILTYTKPIEMVDQYVAPHRDFLYDCYERGQFVSWGRQNPRVGGVILSKGESKEKVWELVKQDPFYIHDVADFEVIEFIPSSPTHKPSLVQ